VNLRVSRAPFRSRSRPSLPSRLATLVVGAAIVAACQPDGGNGGESSRPIPPATQAVPGGTNGPAPVRPEANVISGRVTTEVGTPVAGASLRIVGYTGGANLGQEIETVSSAADGTYRYQVPSGLYEVLGEGPLDFEGQTYLFLLDPADGSCEQEMSEAGIVKDFVLRLSGLMTCLDGVDPENYLFYHGAAVQLFSRLASAAPHDIVEYRLEPVGSLGDGSAGQVLTMQRTVTAHSSSFGPLDGTSYLYDIPLGRYLLSATLLAPAGPVPLLVSTATDPTPAQSVEVSFDPRVIVGTLSVGFSSILPSITVQEGG
jgi:hypothetical protein